MKWLQIQLASHILTSNCWLLFLFVFFWIYIHTHKNAQSLDMTKDAGMEHHQQEEYWMLRQTVNDSQA